MNHVFQEFKAPLIGSTIIFLILGCSGDGVAEEPNAAAVNHQFQQGVYDVFRYQKKTKGHDRARIMIVQTQKKNPQYDLVFLQTKQGEGKGLGFVCKKAEFLKLKDEEGKEKNDTAIWCKDEVEEAEEYLTIGLLDSAFCVAEREKLDDADGDDKAPGDKNPIVTSSECEDAEFAECICYNITTRNKEGVDILAIDPPDNGSGSGGGNN
jgi:hypothetical protein